MLLATMELRTGPPRVLLSCWAKPNPPFGKETLKPTQSTIEPRPRTGLNLDPAPPTAATAVSKRLFHFPFDATQSAIPTVSIRALPVVRYSRALRTAVEAASESACGLKPQGALVAL
jgi:hypothetical protein